MKAELIKAELIKAELMKAELIKAELVEVQRRLTSMLMPSLIRQMSGRMHFQRLGQQSSVEQRNHQRQLTYTIMSITSIQILLLEGMRSVQYLGLVLPLNRRSSCLTKSL